LRYGVTGGGDVLAVDEHQFFALLFFKEMHQADGDHSGGQLVAAVFEECVDMFDV
jgi:hypothetical protein